jgi:hypothetical protein
MKIRTEIPTITGTMERRVILLPKVNEKSDLDMSDLEFVRSIHQGFGAVSGRIGLSSPPSDRIR